MDRSFERSQWFYLEMGDEELMETSILNFLRTEKDSKSLILLLSYLGYGGIVLSELKNWPDNIQVFEHFLNVDTDQLKE